MKINQRDLHIPKTDHSKKKFTLTGKQSLVKQILK